jgi:hypothetical protein
MEGKTLDDPESDLNDEKWSTNFFDTRLTHGIHLVRELACKLHNTLHRHWPCQCGETHSGKIGEYHEAKILLGPNWNSGKEFPGKFQLLLCGAHGLQECEICVIE